MTKEKGYSKTINRLFLLIGIGLLVHAIFLASTIDPRSFELLFRIKWYYIVGITFFAICPWLGHAFRIVMWSRFLDYPINFKTAFAIVMANDIGAAITPTAVGGGPVKIGMLVSKGMPAPKATFMVLLSATEDIIFYAIGILFTMVYMHEVIEKLGLYLVHHSDVLIGAVILVILAIVFWKYVRRGIGKLVQLLPGSWQTWLATARNNMGHYFSDIGQTYLDVIKTGKLRLLLSVLILFFQWFTKFTILALVLHSLNIPFSWFDMYIKQWIVWMSMLVIPTPGSSGGAEAAFLILFKDNLTGDMQNLVVSTWRFFTYYFILILSVIIFNITKGEITKKD